MNEPPLTREQALRLAETRSSKGMPLSAPVVRELLDALQDAISVIQGYQRRGTAGASRGAGGDGDE